MRYKTPALIIIVLLLSSSSLWGDNMDIDPSVGIPLFLKIVTYDENFNSDDYEQIKLFVLYDRSVGESYEQYLEIKKYFKDNPTINVDGVPIQLLEIQINSLSNLSDQFSKTEYNLLVVTKLKEERIRSVAEFSRKNGLHSYSLDADHVSQGITIGVIPGKKSSSIQVNIKSARLEGSKYSARLLKMCDIYEDEN